MTQAKRDIVERLRDADISGHGSYSALVREAADAIERLRAWNYRILQRADAAQTEVERLSALNIQQQPTGKR